LTDARTSTNTVAAGAGLAWSTGTSTSTATSASVSANPTVHLTATLGFPNATKTLSANGTVAETDVGTSTPTANKMPIANASGNLNSWVTGRLVQIDTYTDGAISPAIDSTWHNVAAHTFTSAGLNLEIHLEVTFADGYANARQCGLAIMADTGGTASTIRSTQYLISNGAVGASSDILSGYYVHGSLSTTAFVSLTPGTVTVAIALFAVTGGYNCYIPSNMASMTIKEFQ